MWFFKRKEKKQEKEERTLTVIEESELFILVRAKEYSFLHLTDIEKFESQLNANIVQLSIVGYAPDYAPTFDILMRKKF